MISLYYQSIAIKPQGHIWLAIYIHQFNTSSSPHIIDYSMQPQSLTNTCDIHKVHDQLPHSYYFTLCILVLKFTNKGYFFDEIQDSHFPRKRRCFGTLWIWRKRVNFDVQCFTVKKGCSFGLKSQCFTAKKGIHFELKSQCFIMKKGSFWAEKSVFCHKKGGHFQTGEQGWVPLFPLSEGAGGAQLYVITWEHTFCHIDVNEVDFCRPYICGQLQRSMVGTSTTFLSNSGRLSILNCLI